MKNKVLFLLVNFVLAFAAIANAQKQTIDVNGTKREYITYVPANIEENRPLLISCHGMNQDPNYQKGMLKIETVADTARFITVFPQGINNSWDLASDKDINFVKALIDKMHEQYKIDRGRVYLSGFSMGGMFTYFAMNKIADIIAAFAPISGYPMGGMQFASSRPIPIIHTHGTSDSVVDFGRVQSFIDGWVKRNNCPTTPNVINNYRGASHITRYEYGPGDEGVEVVLMKLAGKDHFISNDKGVLTGDEIWKFCKRYSINMDAPTLEFVSPAKGGRLIMFNNEEGKVNLNVVAKATANKGEIKSVELYKDEVLVGSKSQAPFEWTVEGMTAGITTLKLVATDTEGNEKIEISNVKIEDIDKQFRLDDGFKVESCVPAGWTTYDGDETRIGPSEGYYLGCRIMKMTGKERDFDYGFYGRNKLGKEDGGWLRYGDTNSTSCLFMGKGDYELNALCCNWNMANFGQITFRAVNLDTNETIAEQTVVPTTNIGNKGSNSFSGSTKVVLPFKLENVQRVMIEVVPPVAVYGDMIIADIYVNAIDGTGISGMKNDKDTEDSYIYTIGGTRQKAGRGMKTIYIKNGNKYICR